MPDKLMKVTVTTYDDVKFVYDDIDNISVEGDFVYLDTFDTSVSFSVYEIKRFIVKLRKNVKKPDLTNS